MQGKGLRFQTLSQGSFFHYHSHWSVGVKDTPGQRQGEPQGAPEIHFELTKQQILHRQPLQMLAAPAKPSSSLCRKRPPQKLPLVTGKC